MTNAEIARTLGIGRARIGQIFDGKTPDLQGF